MEEHYNKVQNQEWFNETLEYMKDQEYRNFGYWNFDDTNLGFGDFGRRSFGCWC